jgi:hypothetical protein
MPLKDFLLKKGIDIDKNKEIMIKRIGKEAYDKQHYNNVKRMYKYKALEDGHEYNHSDTDSDDEEPVKKTRMKTMKIDNFLKANHTKCS